MELNVRLNAKDLNSGKVFDALEKLCSCFTDEESRQVTIHPQANDAAKAPSGVTTGSAIANATHAPVVPVTAVPQTPVVPPAAAANNTPAVPVAAPAVSTVPTSAPQYTLEMIAKAGTALIDAGKMHELTALLARYGVETLTALDPAHYGTFANELRAMGAAI